MEDGQNSLIDIKRTGLENHTQWKNRPRETAITSQPVVSLDDDMRSMMENRRDECCETGKSQEDPSQPQT